MSLKRLKRIAHHRATRETVGADEFEDFLKLWWANKYKLPSNHPLLLALTLEELIVDYYTHLFTVNEKEVEKFERELAGKAPKIDPEKAGLSDEDWFKESMGDEYTPHETHSLAYGGDLKKARNEDNNKSGGEEFEDVFDSLGG